MKTLKTIFMILPLMVSCTDLALYKESGIQPDRSEIDASVISLRAETAPGNVISLIFTEGAKVTSVTNDIFICSSVPMDKKCTVELTAGDGKTVEMYSEYTGVEYKLLPSAFYTFAGGKYMDLEDGKTKSDTNTLTIYSRNRFGNVLPPGRYLLPIAGTSETESIKDNMIYIDVTVRGQYKDPDGFELYTGEDMFTVFYLNTSQFDPRLANDMILMTDTGDAQKPQYGIGNIVNLRTASVQYDEVTGNVSVRPSNDLRYVLDHYTECVLPVQESGRKVCICIEGGGKGIGFCNFTDGQITEFAASVRKMIETYGLDGINLWDRNSGYDRTEENSFPEMNTTSYPKLIKTLREFLGNDKLITVTDYEEQTACFHDVAACGGIEVGKLIDYAWSGYCDGREPVQIIDPWHQEAEMVSKLHRRKPIAGLDKKCYGCIHATIYTGEDKAESYIVGEWLKSGLNPNGITIYYDIRSIIQDKFEFSCNTPAYILMNYNSRCGMNVIRLANDSSSPNFIGNQYNKWGKYW